MNSRKKYTKEYNRRPEQVLKRKLMREALKIIGNRYKEERFEVYRKLLKKHKLENKFPRFGI